MEQLPLVENSLSIRTSWTCGPCLSRLACSLPSGNGRQGGALILRGRAATVVEDRVPFLVESELFLGQVRCRPVEKCSPRWSRKQGQLVRMGGYIYGQNCMFVVNDWHASLVPVYVVDLLIWILHAYAFILQCMPHYFNILWFFFHVCSTSSAHTLLLAVPRSLSVI